RVPGTYDLRDYLFTAGGQPATNIPPLPVSIVGLLPKAHSGWLEERALHPPAVLRGYRGLMISLAAAWVIAPFVVARLIRKPKPVSAAPPKPHAPTLAERLRPLVERAAAGTLSADEKALLERMLINHWQRRLELQGLNGSELMKRLRSHPEAGILLRGLEDWLHRPPGSVVANIEALLAPYRELPKTHFEEAVVGRLRIPGFCCYCASPF